MILGKHNNAKYAFLYMLSLVALLFTALGVGQILFNGINYFIKDLPGIYSSAAMPLTAAISMLVIAAPIYFLTMRSLENSLVKGNLDTDAAIRRWLVYFILFVSAVVMIFWLIFTLSNFLDGELTSKFIYKVLTVFVIAGGIFSYYFYDIRRDSAKKKDMVKLGFLIGGLVLTVGSLVFSFFFATSPAEARDRKYDEGTLNNFSQIDSAINSYYTKTKKLPDNLDQARQEAAYLNSAIFQDAVSGKMYEYKKVDALNYELCADFRTSNKDDKSRAMYPNNEDRWQHEAGYQCLKLKAIDYNNQGGDAKTVPLR